MLKIDAFWSSRLQTLCYRLVCVINKERIIFCVCVFSEWTFIIHSKKWNKVYYVSHQIKYVWANTLKVKWSHYSPGVAQRVCRGLALLFHDRGTRRGWVVSGTPWPHFTPRKDSLPILQRAGWVPGPVWTGGKSSPHGDSIPDQHVTK
jgi:hypothetical protein